jgi:hypothetical protein
MPLISGFSGMSPFLALPLEIRQHIYSYLVPCTKRVFYKDNNVVVWKKGNIALLSTCRQTFDEYADILYGQNDFELTVSYDRISFHFRTVTVLGLCPSRSYLFVLDWAAHRKQLLVDKGGIGGVGTGGGGLGAVGATGSGDEQTQTRSKEYFPAATPRYIRRIRRYDICVDHVDSYTGMIKYNCGGPGLNAGFEVQVKKLAEMLGVADEIHLLRVKLAHISRSIAARRDIPLLGGEPEGKPEVFQQVLRPLMDLRGIRRVEISGHVTREFQTALQAAMEEARETEDAEKASRQDRPKQPQRSILVT